MFHIAKSKHAFIMIQSEGRIKKRAKIDEVDKYLRIILLEDGKIVHDVLCCT